MSINSLADKTIIIQKMSAGTADGMGGSSGGAWASWLTGVKARIQPISGEERLLFAQVQERVTHHFYLEPIASSDITTAHRILYGSRTFDIKTVRDIDEQARLLTIDAEETTNA